jgi:hypothetical protein
MPCPRRPTASLIPSTHYRAGGAPRRRDESGETCSAVCPICRGPMTARLGRYGPYFHCLCHERGDRR